MNSGRRRVKNKVGLKPKNPWPRAIDHTKMFPAPREKYSCLLTAQAVNNCIIYTSTVYMFFILQIIYLVIIKHKKIQRSPLF